MEDDLLDLFRNGVKCIADDTDYYAISFNEGIRLCHEIKRSDTSIATAELLLMFERYKQWSAARFYDLSTQLTDRYSKNLPK